VSGAALARWASIERTIADLCLCWTEATSPQIAIPQSPLSHLIPRSGRQVESRVVPPWSRAKGAHTCSQLVKK
jgi:hypothetical protein